MTYQVLARKWRPRDFSQVVGQSHILRALSNALDSGRLHHAYLFTGTRGVGKTTLARVFAKCLNCEVGVSSRPCGVCSACCELDEGRFVDLIEVDAASRTKVDETRDLLDNVQYAPTKGRFKVYLIDEVHMFSNHSFNALLKTLEEPPPHIKFLLATTDPKRLPITILSRCLQLSLKRLSVTQIEGQLRAVVDRESLVAQPAALHQIAVSADGSMRDALSLLDQAVAFAGGELSEQEVATMLGTLGHEHVATLVAALAAGTGPELINVARRVAEYAPDFAQVLAAMLSLLRRVAVVQTVGTDAPELAEEPAVVALAASMSAADCQLFYQIGLLARRDLPLAPDPQTGFEMALLRMLAFRPAGASAGAGAPTPRRATPPTAVPLAPTALAPVPAPVAAPVPAPVAAPVPTPVAAPVAGDGEAGQFDWRAVVEGLVDVTPLTRELARNSAARSFTDGVLDLVLTPQFENLRGERATKALEQALEVSLGQRVVVRVSVAAGSALATPADAIAAAEQARAAAALGALAADPCIQILQREFGARIERVDIKPEAAHEPRSKR